MRRVALLTLLAFGCTTVRQPVPPSWQDAAPEQATRIEPDLELWMEGTGPIDPGEAARAREASVAALSQAIAEHGLEASSGDEWLFVSARGVVRTEERKSAQLWSVIGIGVAVVSIVVGIIVATRGHSASRAPSRVAVPAPPATGHAHPIAPVRPGPYGPYPPGMVPHAHPGPPPFVANLDVWMEFPMGEPLPPVAPPPPPPPWGTPTAAWVESRGWFDRDELDLALTAVDARTGAVRWTSTVHGHVDPRDEGAVSQLVGRAVAERPPIDKTP